MGRLHKFEQARIRAVRSACHGRFSVLTSVLFVVSLAVLAGCSDAAESSSSASFTPPPSTVTPAPTPSASTSAVAAGGEGLCDLVQTNVLGVVRQDRDAASTNVGATLEAIADKSTGDGVAAARQVANWWTTTVAEYMARAGSDEYVALTHALVRRDYKKAGLSALDSYLVAECDRFFFKKPRAGGKPTTNPETEIVPASGEFDLRDQDGYRFTYRFEVDLGDLAVDISDSPPGRAVIAADTSETITITNATSGRNAPSDAVYLRPVAVWPKSSALCSVIVNERGDAVSAGESFGAGNAYCYTEVISAPSSLTYELSDGSETSEFDDIPAGTSKTKYADGVWAKEVFERDGDKLLSAWAKGPIGWMVVGGDLADPFPGACDGADLPWDLQLVWQSGEFVQC